MEVCICPELTAAKWSYRNFREVVEKICATANAVSPERFELYSLQLGTIGGAVLQSIPHCEFGKMPLWTCGLIRNAMNE